MKETLRLIVATAVLVASVSMVAVAPAAAQSDSGLEVDISASDAEPGENITVTYNVTNPGDSDASPIVNATDIPDDWEIVDTTNDGGTQQTEGKWLFLGMESGSSAAPSLTLAVPEDAAGDYTLGVNVTTTSGSTTAETTVSFEAAENGTTAADDSTSGSGPGFGAAVTVVALLAVALLARRQG